MEFEDVGYFVGLFVGGVYWSSFSFRNTDGIIPTAYKLVQFLVLLRVRDISWGKPLIWFLDKCTDVTESALFFSFIH